MKKYLLIFAVLISVSLFACPHAVNPTGPVNYSPVVQSSSSDGIDDPTIFAIYTDKYKSDITIDVDTYFDVWPDGTSVAVGTGSGYEGAESMKITVGSLGWDGWAYRPATAAVVTNYKYLNLALKSSQVDDFNVGMNDGASRTVTASTYGYAADGVWHLLKIPFTALVGLNQQNVTLYFQCATTDSDAGDVYYIDYIYYSQD